MRPLLCTLGISWPIIPEILGLLRPDLCPLFASLPDWGAEIRARIPGPVDQLWIVTTAGTRGSDEVQRWWQLLGAPLPLRFWRTRAIDGTAQEEVELIRELILRSTLAAGPTAVLCLAGGRKTMSADLQRAGMVFGCAAMLHVLPPEPLPDSLRNADPTTLTVPLAPDLACQVQPVWIGRSRPSALLALDAPITSDRFPLPGPGTDTFEGPGPEGWLWRSLESRERDGSRLLANFHEDLSRNEIHENWRSLYRLRPETIRALRSTRLGPEHRAWLCRLPKAELHCHIGGVLDLAEQVTVGTAVHDSLTMMERRQAECDAQPWLDQGALPGAARWTVADPARRAAAAAWLLATQTPPALAGMLWPPGPRVALKQRHSWGFAAYEHPGCLVGSTILQHPAAIAPYAEAIRQRCRRDGLAYIEIRCSPQKYHPGFLGGLAAAINAWRDPGDPIARLICIADRRLGDQAADVVRMTLDGQQRHGGLIVGLDLAGDEQRGPPEELVDAFREAFAACLRITIHAGEGERAENIWKAAYLLHADRIGHGLSLVDAPALASRFRDRRICLELCPTSNREVVGFHDPDHPGSETLYPLRGLLDHGVPLTLCTDNPGISRTTLADEYITAARMADGGLSCWETLSLIKQGFLHAFLPAAERENQLKRIDHAIHDLLAGDPTVPF